MRRGSKNHSALLALSDAGPSGLTAHQAARLDCWSKVRASRLKSDGLIEVRYVITDAGLAQLMGAARQRAAPPLFGDGTKALVKSTPRGDFVALIRMQSEAALRMTHEVGLGVPE